MKFTNFSCLTLFTIFQTLLIVYLFCNQGSSNVQTVDRSTSKESTSDLIDLFYTISSNLGIDKIFHKYHTLYGIYLGPVRHKPLDFLEIGLGCTMRYGPGKSLQAWKAYLTHPNTRISFVEYDRECAQKFNNPPIVENMFIGDQADFEFLKYVGDKGGPYDVIIDDGGHKRTHQVTHLHFGS